MKNRILLSASVFHAYNDAASVMLPMAFPLLYNQKHLITGYSHIGILGNLGLLVTLVFQIFVVHISHHIDYKILTLISLTGITIFLALITVSPNFFALLCLYLLMRIFTSVYHPMGMAAVARTQPGPSMDFAMGIQSGSGNIGVFTAFLSVGYITQAFGWKAPLYIWSATGIFITAICFTLIRNTPFTGRGLRAPDFALWVRAGLRIKPLFPGFLFGGACWGVTVYYAPSLLNHKFTVPLHMVGISLAGWIGVGAFMPYTFGILAKKFGRLRLLILGLSGSTFFVFLLATTNRPWIGMISLFLFGTFLFLIYPSMQSIVGSLSDEEDQTAAFSLAANIQMLSGATFNLASGFLSDRFGISTPFFILFITGIWVIFFTLRKKKYLVKTVLEGES